MRILGIETSCDETAAAVVENGTRVLSNVIASAKDAFLWSGGVIPESAARMQVEYILPVIWQALREARVTPKEIDAIAVTNGPGLLGSLLVGTATSRVLAALWKKPLIGVHHHLGHLSSTWLKSTDEPQFPILALTVSGGHTELWLRTAHTSGQLLGRTRDDAAGEAFDKGANLLGLPYPGGPSIAQAAENGNPHAHAFPNPMHKEDTLDFSFSGLKTALKYLLRDRHFSIPHSQFLIPDIAASYQHAICLHLCDRTARAIARHPQAKEVHLVGGVSANAHLRNLLQETISQRATSNEQPATIRWPVTNEYCTDNAAMIAAAAEFIVAEQGWPDAQFAADASLPLTSVVGNG